MFTLVSCTVKVQDVAKIEEKRKQHILNTAMYIQ